MLFLQSISHSIFPLVKKNTKITKASFQKITNDPLCKRIQPLCLEMIAVLRSFNNCSDFCKEALF